MKKSILSISLVLALVICMCAPAFATTRASSIYPTLYFSGTTANCSVSISAIGKDIDATLELWRGAKKVATWSDSGQHYVTISGTYAATSGSTYTLKVTGTIDDVSINCVPETATCP